MSATWKTVRVFISSTFRDMHTERDHLVRLVFPELRERCAKRHLHLVDVDLRWGVTEEDAQRGKALEICLREIEDCRPFFVGLLGERYGWIPPSYDIPDEERFDALRNIEPGHSITAMEIYHGVLNNPEMRAHAFFYFRDPMFIASLPPERQPDFRAEDDEHAEKLRKLKDRIRASGLPVREGYRYDDLDAFGRQVLEDLWGAIQSEHPEEAPEPDPLDAERAYHDFFIETRTELFIGQRHLLARLHDHAAGESPGPIIVVGTPGCGKSALLARFVGQYRRLKPEAFLLYHFIGASPRSTDPRQMLLRLCQEMARRFGFEEEIPQDYKELRMRFWQSCSRAGERQRVVLVLDALNQLDDTYHSHELDWLPSLVPPKLRLILSTLEGGTLEAARRKYVERQEMLVTSLRLVDRGFVVARQLQQARKRLTTARKYRRSRAERLAKGEPVPAVEDRSQLRFILTGVYGRQEEPTPQQTIQRDTANPLYLRLVAEELRLFGEFERLAEFIARLPVDVPGMFQKVLDRLEHDHGRELVEHSLSLIATGRHGLLEGELLELLARPGEARFPMALWSRLYRNLSFYMKPRASAAGGEEGLIDFFHRQLAKVVRDRYLGNGEAQRARHAELAAYFRRKSDPRGDLTWIGQYRRGLSELPSHQALGKQWDDLKRTLTCFAFADAKLAALGPQFLALDYDLAVLSGERPAGLAESDREIYSLIGDAVQVSADTLIRYPSQLAPQMLGRLLGADVPAIRGFLGEACRSQRCSWFRPLFPSLAPGQGPLLRTLRRHAGGVSAVAPLPDGRRAVSASEDKRLMLWDWERGDVLRILEGHTEEIHAIAVFPDGRHVVSGAGTTGFRGATVDSSLRVWDLETGKEVCKLMNPGAVTAVAVSKDGRWVLSGSVNNKLTLWNLETAKAVRVLEGHSDVITGVLILPDGRAVSASKDHSMKVWDLHAGRELRTLAGHIFQESFASLQPGGAKPRGHGLGIEGIAVTPDSRHLVSASRDRTLKVWDLATGEELRTLSGHRHGVSTVSVLPDGRRAISGSDVAVLARSGNADLKLWDIETGENLATLAGHSGTIHSVAVLPSGRHVISASADGTMKVWDLRTTETARTLERHLDAVTSVALLSDGRRGVSASRDGTSKVWDLQSGQVLHTLTAQGPLDFVHHVWVCSDGRRAVLADAGTLLVWDLESAEVVRRLPIGAWRAVSVMPDMGRAISATLNEASLKVWDLRSGQVLRVLPCSTSDSLVPFAGGRCAASLSAGIEMQIWDLKSGRELRRIEAVHSIGAGSPWFVPTILSPMPDGRRAFGFAVTPGIWDLKTGKQLRQFRTDASRPAGRIAAMCVLPDSRHALTAHDCGVLRLWDLATGQMTADFVGDGPFSACASGADGVTVVAGDVTGRVHFLRIEHLSSPADQRAGSRRPWWRLWQR